MSYTSVKGMNDILPPQSLLWSGIEAKVRTVFESFGFSEIKTPVVEKTSLFTHSVGTTTDIIEKQMYVFEDKNKESLALRPEGTAPVVRAYVEHQLYHPDPYQKLYYWGPMYRYERMQKGRYRQFYQFGVEIFGSSSPKIDAETIFMLNHLLTELGIEKFETEINSLGCGACRPAYRDTVSSFFKRQARSFCEDCQRRVETNPLRILDCKNEECKKIAAQAPTILNELCSECKAHFEDVKSSLQKLNVAFKVNPFIVRGLDYYVRTAFEIVSNELGSQNAIGGGGRYDGLVKTLGGADIPAFGFACGIERLILILESKVQSKLTLDLFIAALGEKAQHFSFELIQKLRLKGIRVDMDYEDHALKAQMKKADRMNAKYVLIIGDDELAKGEGILRDMVSKEQKILAIAELTEEILRAFGPQDDIG